MDTTIFTREEIDRIQEDSVDGRKVITVDLHEMHCAKAKRFVKNLIALNFREPFEMDVIHGYNGGVELKKMIHGTFLSPRVQTVRSSWYNPGLSILQVRK